MRKSGYAILLALSLLGFAIERATADEPSAEYQAGLRREAERRKQRRANAAARQPVGTIVPFPMPPSLVIRQTAGVHEEVEDFLGLLRGERVSRRR